MAKGMPPQQCRNYCNTDLRREYWMRARNRVCVWGGIKCKVVGEEINYLKAELGQGVGQKGLDLLECKGR